MTLGNNPYPYLCPIRHLAALFLYTHVFSILQFLPSPILHPSQTSVLPTFVALPPPHCFASSVLCSRLDFFQNLEILGS